MGRKINGGRIEMRALPQARKSRREHLMTVAPKASSYAFPAPATVPRPVNKHISNLVRRFRNPLFAGGADPRPMFLCIRSCQRKTRLSAGLFIEMVCYRRLMI